MNKIKKLFKESIKIKKEILNSNILDVIERMGDEISNSIKNGGKIMLCGNGGSAADAQHLAAEMLIRLRPKYNRGGLPAIALAQDVSTITACGNDFGFDRLFERTLESPSCNSPMSLSTCCSCVSSAYAIKPKRQTNNMQLTDFIIFMTFPQI